MEGFLVANTIRVKRPKKKLISALTDRRISHFRFLSSPIFSILSKNASAAFTRSAKTDSFVDSLASSMKNLDKPNIHT